MDELKYWMNDDTGHVIAMEDSPGRLWFEIDFELYDMLTRPGTKRANKGSHPTGGNVAAICNCHPSYGIHSDWCPANPTSG